MSSAAGSSAAEPSAAGPAPVFRVVRGSPTPEELAALVGVLLARPRGAAAAVDPTPSPWVRLARPGTFAASDRPARPGADAWRASGLPR